ncbi:carboxylating nicotinate-nucleotide diphosphorylase [Patescibacteria group bacterium]
MKKDRAQIAKQLFNQKDQLVLDNLVYKQWVFKYTFLELEKDLGQAGDITTESVVHNKVDGVARIYANEPGLMAGSTEIVYFLMTSDPTFRPRLESLEVIQSLQDGKTFEKDDILLEIKGDVRNILKIERIILNFLQHMCGIATYTKKLIDIAKEANPKVLIVPTRKTTWGLLDKKAVTIAGAGTHRLNLENAILIKDNHIALHKNIEKLLNGFKKPKNPYAFFEIEIDEKGQVLKTARKLQKLDIPKPPVIMFDNMKPKDIEELIALLKKENLYDDLLFEASGGINKKNLASYARSGVDIISMGALTQNIKPVDLSLEIKI